MRATASIMSSAMLAERWSMIGARLGHAGRHHVGIADGLDFLDAVLCGEFVEAT